MSALLAVRLQCAHSAPTWPLRSDFAFRVPSASSCQGPWCGQFLRYVVYLWTAQVDGIMQQVLNCYMPGHVQDNHLAHHFAHKGCSGCCGLPCRLYQMYTNFELQSLSALEPPGNGSRHPEKSRKLQQPFRVHACCHHLVPKFSNGFKQLVPYSHRHQLAWPNFSAPQMPPAGHSSELGALEGVLSVGRFGGHSSNTQRRARATAVQNTLPTFLSLQPATQCSVSLIAAVSLWPASRPPCLAILP